MLSDDSLANEILSEQIKNKWPGIGNDAIAIAEEMKVEGLFNPDLSKQRFKKIVREACEKANEESL